MAYKILYSPSAEEHLQALTARECSIVLDSVEEQLAHEPMKETRNRKPMRPNPIAPWELRCGQLRVYYDVQEKPEPAVIVLAVGMKVRNQIRIGGKEVQL